MFSSWSILFTKRYRKKVTGSFIMFLDHTWYCYRACLSYFLCVSRWILVWFRNFFLGMCAQYSFCYLIHFSSRTNSIVRQRRVVLWNACTCWCVGLLWYWTKSLYTSTFGVCGHLDIGWHCCVPFALRSVLFSALRCGCFVIVVCENAKRKNETCNWYQSQSFARCVKLLSFVYFS